MKRFVTPRFRKCILPFWNAGRRCTSLCLAAFFNTFHTAKSYGKEMKSGRYKGCIDVWNFVCSLVPPLPLALRALYRLSRKKRRAAISIGKKREKKRENCTSELVLLTREIARSNDAKLFLRWKGIANRWNNPLYSFDEIIFCKVKGISKGENILTILMKIIPFLRNRCTTTFPTFVKMKFKGREVHDNFTANFIIR